MFTGSPELSLNVKEEDVERIFQLLVECTDMFAQSQLMETLDAMAKVWHHFIFDNYTSACVVCETKVYSLTQPTKVLCIE